MAIDPHVRATDEPSRLRARLWKFVTLTALVVGGASLLAVGGIPSTLSRASTSAGDEAAQVGHKPGSGLKLGLIGECGVDEPEPVNEGTDESVGSCGGPIAGPAAPGGATFAENDELAHVDLDAVGRCSANVASVAISALGDNHLPAELLLTAHW